MAQTEYNGMVQVSKPQYLPANPNSQIFGTQQEQCISPATTMVDNSQLLGLMNKMNMLMERLAPHDSLLANKVQEHPVAMTQTQKRPGTVVPLADSFLFTHTIAANPALDRLFIYTGNAFFNTTPILAYLASLNPPFVATIQADAQQSFINANLQNTAIAPNLIKLNWTTPTPPLVNIIMVRIQPGTNQPFPYNLAVDTFVVNTQFIANIIQIPPGFKLGSDCALLLPVPQTIGVSVVMEG